MINIAGKAIIAFNSGGTAVKEKPKQINSETKDSSRTKVMNLTFMLKCKLHITAREEDVYV